MYYAHSTITLMKQLYVLLIALILSSCGKGKSVLLPEIENAAITEIHDVSHAYLFYDETQPDSVELNRKNLISTTNWLINVDKRLTLEQAIPKIKFLQDKKRNAKMHKNEDAKNYYTCHDTTINNLGFLEFTDVKYIIDIDSYNDKTIAESEIKHITISFLNEYMSISEIYNSEEIRNETFQMAIFKDELKRINKDKRETIITLMFSAKLNFQNYISIKSEVSKIESTHLSISSNEFIY